MVITISREYGACGNTVAKALSEKLGLEYYDIDLRRMAAQVSGYSEEDVRREGEDLSGGVRFLNQFLNGTAAYKSSYDEIYQAQRAVVLDLAQKKPCIIVGRCSNVILREEGIPTFDIFLYADKEFRLKRAAELNENGDMDLAKFLEQRDHWRSNYYKTYTSHEMGYYRDYDICLDVGKIGVDYCSDVLADLIRRQMEK